LGQIASKSGSWDVLVNEESLCLACQIVVHQGLKYNQFPSKTRGGKHRKSLVVGLKLPTKSDKLLLQPFFTPEV
jgi:hypothetical protein